MNRIFIICAMLALAACSPKPEPASAVAETAAPPAPPVTAEAPVDVPAGAYTMDLSHTSVIFRVDHLGFSNYTARFRKSAAQLQFDPNDLGSSTLTATIDANSLETDFPDPAKVDFNKQLLGEEWLSGAKFPTITFRSTRVEPTGARTMRINGELTMRGVTKPMVLDAKFNGGYAGHPMDKNARIGFSAHGVLKRSDFGISFGIPAPGTTMGVGDEVSVVIETEFNGPPWAEAPKEGAASGTSL